jgi:hypothetical protein
MGEDTGTGTGSIGIDTGIICIGIDIDIDSGIGNELTGIAPCMGWYMTGMNVPPPGGAAGTEPEPYGVIGKGISVGIP